uniref:HSF-type DNA-binding domain-containing protein n=1 Tax=Skeletonema marinoi TaxID=267567 RepID=A0A7S2MAD3_9STRA|mmetsp:Transcript_6829/g.11490  ORF Transcript_6829/g.11490 Transcript_6829/m.11490 type:complete len:372 (+) Transcript_6829:87-1202(+)
MKMNPPSENDWKIASSIASAFVVGDKGGFPNAKFVFHSAPSDDDEEASSDNLPRRFADHTYRDFSTYIKDGGKVQKHKKSESNFPARLYAMLAEENYSHIISWMPHGRAFKVHNKKLLLEEALPKYTGQSKISSFTRQLSGWGFKRLHQMGLDYGCYYHECFLQGHPRLTILMRRISPGQGKATPNAYEEPDFYMTAKQFPLHPTGEEPLFSPDNDKFEDKKEGEGVVTNKVESISQEETKLDPLAAHKNMDSIEPNQNNLDSVDMAWTRVAPICMEDGLCLDPHCHGSNENEQYSEGMVPAEDAPPGIPYLQSLLHNLLVYKDENSDGLSQNPLPLIDFVDEDSLDEMLMNMPEQDLGLTHVDYSSHDFP